MSKITGLGGKLWIDQYDVSGDIGSIGSIASSRAQIDVTSIQDTFMSRLPGLGDGSIAFDGYFNPAAGNFHTAYGSAFGTALVQVTTSFGTAVGAAAASIGAARTSYNVARGADGALAVSAAADSGIGYGTDWGYLLNGGASATGTATSTVDNGAATSLGAQAYLHVTAVAAGTVTITVQDSADNSSFSNVTGLSFTATAGGTAQWLATAGTASIRQYTRYNCSGGTASFSLNLSRN